MTNRIRPTLTAERRCVRCGDPWSDTAPPCCYDPVDDILTVRRTPRGNDVLTEVLDSDGCVISGVITPRVA